MSRTKAGKDLLTDGKIKSAKPKDKAYKLPDGGGLYLVVEASRKWWKMRTVFGGRESSFSLGEYPTVSLSAARGKRDEVKKKMAAGLDPAIARREEKARHSGENTLESFANPYSPIEG